MQNAINNNKQSKPDQILYLKLKQLQYEREAWKRLLGFMIDENISMKNRLSEVLKDPFDHNLLEQLESFHNKFIREDELVGFLRCDVVELEKLLGRGIFNDESIMMKIDTKSKDLRRSITVAEKLFGKLKSDFNNYLSENI